MDPVNAPTKFEVLALHVWVGVAYPKIWEEEAIGGRDGTLRKSIGEFL